MRIAGLGAPHASEREPVMIMFLQIVAMPILGFGLLVGMAHLERAIDAGRDFADVFALHRHRHSG